MTEERDDSDSRSSGPVSLHADRREVVFGAAAFAAGIAAATPNGARAAEGAEGDLQPGDRFEIVRGELKGELLRPELLTMGDRPVECFPVDPASGELRRGNRLNRALAVRLDAAEMKEDTLARQVDGVLLYSAVCTHKGCTIKSWKAEERILRCHCHLSEFAALDGGRVMNGPAMHELPAVPLAVDDDGFVVAVAGFTEAPGGKTK